MDTEDRIKRLERLMAGNGEPGLDSRVRRMEQHMFHDNDTDSPGLVNIVNKLSDSMNHFRSTLRTLNYLLAFFGLGGVLAAISWLAGG